MTSQVQRLVFAFLNNSLPVIVRGVAGDAGVRCASTGDAMRCV